MALITPEELATYLQRDIARSTAVLVIELVEDAIYTSPHGSRITEPPQRGIRGLVFEVCRRATLNPANVQTESANGTSVTFMPIQGRGIDLTDRELEKLAGFVGASAAYTVDVLDEGLGQRVWPGPRQTPTGWPG